MLRERSACACERQTIGRAACDWDRSFDASQERGWRSALSLVTRISGTVAWLRGTGIAEVALGALLGIAVISPLGAGFVPFLMALVLAG